MADAPAIAVLHVALNPITGPWSVMRELALAQAATGRYAAVGFGIIHDARWPESCRADLRDSGLPAYTSRTPALFGTAQFMWQVLCRPGIEAWVADLRQRSGARRVVVHFHNAWMTGVFLPLRAPPGSQTRCVATFHGVNAELGGKPLRHAAHHWMAQRLLRSDTCLTSVDAANLERARDILALPPERFTVIANGVPLAAHPGCPYARGADTLTLGHVGAISARKGWHLAADAAIQAAASGRRIRVRIAGAGDESAAAADLAARHPDVVTFTGHVRNPRASLVPELDLLAVMSVQEGLPMTIIEAQSAGVPAAATAVGGIPQAVRPGISGFLVERSAAALASVLCGLYDDRPALAALQQSTLALFKANFAIDRIIDQYDALYATPQSSPSR